MSSGSCEVLPGPGSVARRGSSMAWASEQTPDAVWETLRNCLALGERLPGAAMILRAVAAAVLPGLSPGASFALLLSDGVAGVVLRHGAAEVRVDGQPLQSGPVTAVTVAGKLVVLGSAEAIGSGGEHDPMSRHDLTEGSVPGAAARWLPPARRYVGAAPASAGFEPDGLEDVGAGQHIADEDAPGPVMPATAPPGLVVQGSEPAAVATGWLPAGDALAESDDPDDPNQTQLHPPPDPDSDSARPDPGSVGVLIFEDGTSQTLDGDVVLGRRPERHDLVEAGDAQPVTIHDPEHVLSSAHAALRRQGGHVVVVDLDSLNGTHVAASEARDWTRLSAGEPYRIADGDRILLGWTVLTYRSPG